MPHSYYTWEELADKIDNEGFDYYFCDYENPSEFRDPMLLTLVLTYRQAAKGLKDYLRRQGGLL